jgi:hypothetical protein
LYRNITDKIIEIYNRSELNVSKFAKIIGKDRRTVSSWINKEVIVEPKEDVLNKINKFFRYSEDIWDNDCQDNDFINAISSLPSKDIRIIDEDHENRLEYILKKESKQRLVIHPKFPGPVYRDAVGVKKYTLNESTNIKKLKNERIEKMLSYSYKSDEWYDIKSLLSFCFSQIGNFYTKNEKIAVLKLMYDTFHDNYNKHLFFYDSFSKKIYGMDTMYTSVMIQEEMMFFKSPLESVFIEIQNKEIVDKIHKYFTSGKEAPSHIPPYDAPNILKILRSAVANDLTLFETYKIINENTNYGKYIKNNISISCHDKLY